LIYKIEIVKTKFEFSELSTECSLCSTDYENNNLIATSFLLILRVSVSLYYNITLFCTFIVITPYVSRLSNCCFLLSLSFIYHCLFSTCYIVWVLISTVILFILYTHIRLTYQLMPLPLLHSFICSILPSFETLALDHFLFAVIEERAIIPVCMPKTRSIPEIRRL